MGVSQAVIEEIWRYPVSSLGGERLDRSKVSNTGLDGDRTHLLFDTVTGEVAAPETTPRWRRALFLSACLIADDLLVSCPDWGPKPIGAELDAAVSDFLGFNCAIRPCGATIASSGRHATALAPRYDKAPIHIISTANLDAMEKDFPDRVFDRRRFRPNVVIRSLELDEHWIGKRWDAGRVSGHIMERTKRCGMTMVAQPGIKDDPEILRAIVRKRRRCLGVYAGVMGEGAISVGDVFSLS